MNSNINSPELKDIWKDHDSILERSMKLNIFCVEKIQTQRSKSKLRPLLFLRIAEAIVTIIISYFLSSFLENSFSNINYAVPLSLLIVFSLYSLYLCISQIIIILRINFSHDIIDIQKKLALLQTHILDYFRLSFIVIPFWLLYPLIGIYIFSESGSLDSMSQNWIFTNLIFGLIVSVFCIYAYTQISYRNIHKRWVRFFIRNAGGKSVTEASEFLKEIYEFEKD